MDDRRAKPLDNLLERQAQPHDIEMRQDWRERLEPVPIRPFFGGTAHIAEFGRAGQLDP